MATFSLYAQVIKRSAGRSAVRCAAYRAGEELEDERLGETYSYTSKPGVEHTEIIAPDLAPDWVYVEHARFAKERAMKLGPAAKEFAESYHLGDPGMLKPADVFGPFMKFLQERAAAKESA